MFLKLYDIEDSEKKDFILETLRREFRDVAIEARNFFEYFNMLGSPVKVVGTAKEDFKVPIPCKLVGMHEALEKNFNWIYPENLFDESSVPKHDHKEWMHNPGTQVQIPADANLGFYYLLKNSLWGSPPPLSFQEKA
jgi:hypothetical protein